MICPISYEIMEDPVELEDGTVYDRVSILKWFKLGNKTSPLTNMELTSMDMKTRYDIAREIKEWKINNITDYNGCRNLDCRFYGTAPDFLCTEHSDNNPQKWKKMTETENEIIEIFGASIMNPEEVRVYCILLNRIVLHPKLYTDWNVLEIRKNLRAEDSKRLYMSYGKECPYLQTYLVKYTLCPWLLDKDMFMIGLCYMGNFGESPKRSLEIEKFINRVS